MTNSYDLTPDDRGLKLGRLIDADLVLARNVAYGRWRHAKQMEYNGATAAYRSMYYILDALIDGTATENMLKV